MSDKLPRYDPDLATYGEYRGMEKDEYGSWCCADDVEKLEAERDALKTRNERLEAACETFEQSSAISLANAGKAEEQREELLTACRKAADCFRRAIPWSARKPIDAALAKFEEGQL